MRKLIFVLALLLLPLTTKAGEYNNFNNNADAVVTTTYSGQAAAWLYAFNGTTWDRLQVDASKNLKIAVTNWGGGVLGAMANYGTSPGAVLVPGFNAFITNIPAVTQ